MGDSTVGVSIVVLVTSSTACVSRLKRRPATIFMKIQITEYHGLDTSEAVYFYEQDFYVLSNFSAFALEWKGLRFDTSEAAYHWEKFPEKPDVQDAIRLAKSAHLALKLAEYSREKRRPDWDAVRIDIMREILRTKVNQHLYVEKKLLATGNRELIENSWRDDFWGYGPNKDGKNILGNLWMEIRDELRNKLS